MSNKEAKLSIVGLRFYLVLTGCLLGLVGACDNGGREDIELSLNNQIENLQQQKTELLTQIEQARIENQQLRNQMQVLSKLRAEAKLEELYTLQRIKIHKYTGFYDKDDDGKTEKLIVYVQPIDKQGDIIKVPGSADVELWDLNKEQNEARLGQWHMERDQLKDEWFTTLIKGNYRLVFDITDKVHDFTQPLTVKVTFTDYITGKEFQEQRVIEP
ncbi:MAG: hypothetical protein ACYS8I_00960 [Planctomycetota bacterium]|jgi:hypothetical protein